MTGMNYPIVPPKCERARRVAGLSARLNCTVCGRGPCSGEYKDARDVPNRLYGAEINHEGDAI